MKIFGLIGYPLIHSFSKIYFDNKFDKEKITGSVYKLFPLSSADELPELIKTVPGLAGLNVTIPYKISVIKYMDFLDKTASETGAVNVIKIIRSANDLKLHGFNTDFYGIEQALLPELKPWHNKALILGNGGASKAVQYFCRKNKIDFTIISRNPQPGHLAYSDITKSIIENSFLIINTTPLGMYPGIKSFPKIPYGFLSSKHLLFDLVYNPSETEFLKKGKEQGAGTINGIKMFEYQAEKSCLIWQGKDL